MNSLAVLAGHRSPALDLALAALSLSQIEPGGPRRPAHAGGCQRRATLIDESYNANPASMAAALNVLGAARRPAWPRIAVPAICRTRPPGPCCMRSDRRHQGQPHRSGILLWPLMRICGTPFPRANGRLCDSADTLESQVVGAIRAGDADHGQGIAPLEDENDCECARKALSRQAAHDEPRMSGLMFYWLIDLSNTVPVWHVPHVSERVSLHHLRTTERWYRGVVVFLFGPWIIDHLDFARAKASRSQRWPAIASRHQDRHDRRWRLMILSDWWSRRAVGQHA